MEKIVIRKISELIPDRMARPVDRGRVDYLKTSIAKIGLTTPIFVQGDTIMDGLHRFIACKELGWETIPTRRL